MIWAHIIQNGISQLIKYIWRHHIQKKRKIIHLTEMKKTSKHPRIFKVSEAIKSIWVNSLMAWSLFNPNKPGVPFVGHRQTVQNPNKPGVPFVGHRQTVLTPIKCHIMQHLIRVHCLLTGFSITNRTKMKKIHLTPLKWQMDSPNV